jgi:hypothetical protein
MHAFVAATYDSVNSHALARWGHCSVQVNGAIWTIGGYGGAGATHSRLTDVLCLSCCDSAPAPSSSLLAWHRVATSGDAFSARMYGACVAATFTDDSSSIAAGTAPPTATPSAACILYHGGRGSPSLAFGETFILHLQPSRDGSTPLCRWQLLTRDGPPLFRHSMVALDASAGVGPQRARVLAIGGLSPGPEEGQGIGVWSFQHSGLLIHTSCSSSSSCSSFSSSACKDSGCVWEKIATTGDVPPPVHSHTTTLLPASGCVVLIGGASPLGRCSRSIYTLDTSTWVWRRSAALLPIGLMSHSSALPSCHALRYCDNLSQAHCFPMAE